MCVYPAWLEAEVGTQEPISVSTKKRRPQIVERLILFLTDKDIDDQKRSLWNNRDRIGYDDAVHHSQISQFYTGQDLRIMNAQPEGFPCKPLVAEVINAGRTRKIAKAWGFQDVRLSKDGELHDPKKPAVEGLDGISFFIENGHPPLSGDPTVISEDLKNPLAWFQKTPEKNVYNVRTMIPKIVKPQSSTTVNQLQRSIAGHYDMPWMIALTSALGGAPTQYLHDPDQPEESRVLVMNEVQVKRPSRRV